MRFTSRVGMAFMLFFLASFLSSCTKAGTSVAQHVAPPIDLRETITSAKSIRARNVDCREWGIVETDWVDLSQYADKISPCLFATASNIRNGAYNVVCRIEAISADDHILSIDVVCSGKAPFMFIYNGTVYIRNGEYYPLNLLTKEMDGEEVFTSESLELTAAVDNLRPNSKNKAGAFKAFERLSLSMGVGKE